MVGVVRSGIIMLDVFGADALFPRGAQRLQVSLRRRPGRDECVRIFDPEFQLQAASAIAAVHIVTYARPFLFGALFCGFSRIKADKPVALNDMESLRVRCTETVDHWVRSGFYADR